jgi:hypothetical protein
VPEQDRKAIGGHLYQYSKPTQEHQENHWGFSQTAQKLTGLSCYNLLSGKTWLKANISLPQRKWTHSFWQLLDILKSV